MNALATEEAKYDVVEKDGKIEIRDYASRIIAGNIVEGALEDSGNNQSCIELTMTAPISQKSAREKSI